MESITCRWYARLVIVVGCKKTDYTPDPLHTPAQNASTSLPSFCSSSGLISDSGTLRTQRSCVVGLRFGLNLRYEVELKMGSDVVNGTNVDFLVKRKNVPKVAAAPTEVILIAFLMIPMDAI